MANINSVNLTKFKAEIEAYNTTASQLHTSVVEICKNLQSLQNCWSGKRINTVITLWNNNYETISKQTFYFAMQIKLILMEIYDQYSALEAGKPRNSGYGYGWGGILKVPLTNESNIMFIQSRAKSILSNIALQNSKANIALKELTTKLDTMQSYSDSLSKLRAYYKKNATDLANKITKVCKQIEIEAESAYSDTQATENFNLQDSTRANNVQN